MADQKRWFKVWTSIVSDDAFDPQRAGGLATVGRFCLLGAYVALHGNNGVVMVRLDTLLRMMQLPNLEAIKAETVFAHVNFQMPENDNGKVTVTFLRWSKYQVDSTVYDRVKKHRKLQSVTVQEEIRREEINPPIVPPNPDVKKFIDHAFEKVLKQTGKKMLIDGKKDGEIVKKLLSTYGLDQLKGLWDAFMRSTDPFIRQAGLSIGVFKTQVNKLLTGASSKQQETPL